MILTMNIFMPILALFKHFYWSTVDYNVVIISGVWQTESNIYIYPLFFRFFYKILSRVPCSTSLKVNDYTRLICALSEIM